MVDISILLLFLKRIINQVQKQARKEQSILRGILFKNFLEFECSICNRVLPTDLLVAAHIKPRSKCSTSERKNPNNVIPMCKLGCDEFFEKSYLIVDERGIVCTNKKRTISSELKSILDSLSGSFCKYFNNETEKFFEYKRKSFKSNNF